MTFDPVYDDAFGLLTWDSGLDWWTGEVEPVPGQRVGISLSPEDEPLETLLPLARRTYGAIVHDEESLRRAAADELLEIYNSEWSETDPVDEDTFVSLLSLRDINFLADGAAELFYEDGGLFQGHTVLVSVDDEGRFADADIAG